MSNPGPLVIIESPYAPAGGRTVQEHETYARAAVRDSLDRGEAPFASHLFYTQPEVLDDNDPLDRALGLHCGWLWMSVASLVAVYVDHGMSQGMNEGVKTAQRLGIPVEYRSLNRKAST